MGRWDHLFDLKSKPLTEHLLDEVAGLLSQELAEWPPTVIEWTSDSDHQRFAPLFRPEAPRPGAMTFREAFRLARWEMQRDVFAIDAYMTETQWRSAGVSDAEFLALLFLHQWLVEQMLGLTEVTGGRIKRPQLEECLGRAERRFARISGASWNPTA
jgi:hypothetical protein